MMRRVGSGALDPGVGCLVARWSRVGMWACDGESAGWGWVRMTMLNGFFGSRVVFLSSCSALGLVSALSSAVEPLTGAVGGAVLAASASRCLVTLFRPTRICEPIAGGAGGEASFAASFGFRFLLPFEGVMCDLRCSPRGESRLGRSASIQ